MKEKFHSTVHVERGSDHRRSVGGVWHVGWRQGWRGGEGGKRGGNGQKSKHTNNIAMHTLTASYGKIPQHVTRKANILSPFHRTRNQGPMISELIMRRAPCGWGSPQGPQDEHQAPYSTESFLSAKLTPENA